MDKRALNRCLNSMKNEFPNENALIEGIQDILNKKVVVISDTNKRALRMFPMQFIQRINIGNGEWTTQLHIWADNLVDTFLELDPIVLTARNSYDETVLHHLVMAALGKYTQKIDYIYIQKLLNKNMGYVKLNIPGDETSKMQGNAWAETDNDGRTAMDYLIDRANGDILNNVEEDTILASMLESFASSPTLDEAPVDNTPQPLTPQEDEIQKQQFAANEQEVNQTLETNPAEVGNLNGNAEQGNAPQPDMTTAIQDKQNDQEQARDDQQDPPAENSSVELQQTQPNSLPSASPSAPVNPPAAAPLTQKTGASAQSLDTEKAPETAKSHPAPEDRVQNTEPKAVQNAMLEALLNY